MVWEDHEGWVMTVDSASLEASSQEDEISAQDEISEQLQRVYECILDERRPEAVAGTERLAEQLGIDIERPPHYPKRKSR